MLAGSIGHTSKGLVRGGGGAALQPRTPPPRRHMGAGRETTQEHMGNHAGAHGQPRRSTPPHSRARTAPMHPNDGAGGSPRPHAHTTAQRISSAHTYPRTCPPPRPRCCTRARARGWKRPLRC